MKIERRWRGNEDREKWEEITEERAAKELANAWGSKAVKILTRDTKLETRFAFYQIVD
jgi:hypothetical protein